MDNFNLKQFLIESRTGMYSKTVINENALLDAEVLGAEIAKAHPELLGLLQSKETKKLQDNIFKYAGEILHNAGIPLQTVRGLAYDANWAMELVSTVGDKLEHSEGSLEEDDYSDPANAQSGDTDAMNINEVDPAALGVGQAEADAEMQQQDDLNGDMVSEEEDPSEQIGVAYANKVAPAETNLDKYLSILHNYDWFHHFSDDPRAWRQGQADKENLKALYGTLVPMDKQKAMDTYIDKYLQLHDPKQFPSAANNVKYLTTDTFKGTI